MIFNAVERRLNSEGSKLELKPLISNHNQELLDTYFMILWGFSLIFMENIVIIWDKTITKTSAGINSTDKSLKDIMVREVYKGIKQTVLENEQATKWLLKQRKLINYIHFQYRKFADSTTLNTDPIQKKASIQFYLKLIWKQTNHLVDMSWRIT